MAAKKSPPDNRLTSSPFKALKGLSASDRPESADSRPASPSPPAEDEQEVSRASEPPVADDELFRQEMAWLGVNRRAGRDASDPERGQKSASDSPKVSEKLAEQDADLFRSAVGRMDMTFAKDEAKEADSRPRARRARQLKQGRIKPEAELDLHGLRREEALVRVGYFLENARHHGFQCVLIITGKGMRSSGGAVLRAAVLDWLTANREGILEWTEAPRQYGGSGGLVVFLGPRPSTS